MTVPRSILILILVTILHSCATKYRNIAPVLFAEPVYFYSNTKDSIDIFFFKDVLDPSQNRKLYRWAKRHDCSFTGVKIVNRSGKFRKGFQLRFFCGNKRLIPLNPAWVAKKARTRTTAAPFVGIPFMLMEEAVLPDPPVGPDGFELYPEYSGTITQEIVSQDNQNRKMSNAEMRADLKSMDISSKALPAGKPVYGLVIFKNSFSTKDLRVEVQ